MITWDATFNGVPLSVVAYEAHLKLLREFSDGRAVSAWRATTLDGRDEYVAWCALNQHGIIATIPRSTTTDITWDEFVVTDYGRLYARQRGIEVAAHTRGTP